MKKSLKFFIPLFLIIGPAWWMTRSALKQNSVTCEVCMEFNGQRNCAKAQGENTVNCQRTGTDTACGTLASGVQQTIQCGQKGPASLKYF